RALPTGSRTQPSLTQYSSTLLRSTPLKRTPTPRSSAAASKWGLRGLTDRRSGGVSLMFSFPVTGLRRILCVRSLLSQPSRPRVRPRRRRRPGTRPGGVDRGCPGWPGHYVLAHGDSGQPFPPEIFAVSDLAARRTCPTFAVPGAYPCTPTNRQNPLTGTTENGYHESCEDEGCPEGRQEGRRQEAGRGQADQGSAQQVGPGRPDRRDHRRCRQGRARRVRRPRGRRPRLREQEGRWRLRAAGPAEDQRGE